MKRRFGLGTLGWVIGVFRLFGASLTTMRVPAAFFAASVICGATPAFATEEGSAAKGSVLSPASEDLGPPLSDLAKLQVNAATYPHDDKVVLYRGVLVRLDRDGRVSRRVRTVQRLLTDLAIGQEGDPRVAYDTTRQELSIHQCRTIMLDGREIPPERRAFNRVTPDRLASCPDRTGLQEMVISRLGLERGCLVELDYTLADRISFRPWCESCEELGGDAPVLAGEVIVDLPSPDQLKATLIGTGDSSIVQSRVEGTRHRWRYGPLPGIPWEGGISSLDRTAHLLISTCPTWDVLLTQVRDRIEGSAAADSAILTWSRGPMQSHRPPLDANDRRSRVSWLIRERTAPAEDYPLAFWLPVRPAARTFASSCGNLCDRAALALSAMRAAGESGRIALRPALGRVPREVPALALIDDIWLLCGSEVLSIRSGVMSPRPDPGWAVEYLDPENRPARPDGSRDGSLFVPLPPRRGRSELSIRLHENEDGTVEGEAALRVGGAICRSLDCADLKGFLQSLAAKYARKVELADYRVQALSKDTLDVAFSITAKALGDSLGGGRQSLRLPTAPGAREIGFPTEGVIRRAERMTPLELPCMLEEETHLRLELGEKTRAVAIPADAKIEGKGATLETSIKHDGNALLIHRRFTLGERRVEPSMYPAFRKVWLRKIGESYNTIYLERTGS